MSRKGRRKSPQLKAMQREWNAARPSPIAPKPYGSAKNSGSKER